jgi:hypothetical protein
LDKVTPGYLSVDDLIPEDMGPDNFKSLVDMCQTYSPDTKMVVYAAVCIWSEVRVNALLIYKDSSSQDIYHSDMFILGTDYPDRQIRMTILSSPLTEKWHRFL